MDVKMVFTYPFVYDIVTLENLRVIRQVPPSVGKMLDNCRVWTDRINDNEPVMCGGAAFQWLPKRHGHVFCPSWEYTGLCVDAINANTKTKVLPGWRHQDMKAAVTGAWLRWLPGSLLHGLHGLDLLVNPLPVGKKCFSLREVAMCKTFLALMVVTPIDKCNPSLNLLI